MVGVKVFTCSVACVAQLVRALVCGTRGRGFKSHHTPHIREEVKDGNV